MLYDPSTNSALHAWLVRTLEPICDAEPEALATYIIALLKHDVPEQELHQEVVKQLDEFFENGAIGFVDTLFSALRSKSYVPYTSTPAQYPPLSDKSQDSGIPIPFDALISPSTSTSQDRGLKRRMEEDGHDARGPPKGPRRSNDAYFARTNGHGQMTDNSQRGPMDGQMADYSANEGIMNGMNGGGMNGHIDQGVRPYQPPNTRVMLPRGVCRDYHLKGFCSRGAMCKYSHDDAAFAPQMSMSVHTGNMPFMGMYGGFGMNTGQISAYDPNDSRLDMPPRGAYQRIPTMPRAQDETGDPGHLFNSRGELPVIQDLTPSRPQEESVAMDLTPASLPDRNAPPTSAAPDVQMHHPPPPTPSDLNGSSHVHHAPSLQGVRPPRGGNVGFRARGRSARGTFGGDHQNFNTGGSSKTIVVEKIPEEHLSLEAVNGWFKRFGTVTNVAVDAPGGKALVSFSTHEEARAAWGAEEAVFNNRFVKIFWHRPMEGQGAAGTRALQASASLVANIAAREKAPALLAPEVPKSLVTPAPAATLTQKIATSTKLTALQTKQELLEKQISEQKELMAKFGSATAEGKKEIMVRLRKLAAEMKAPSAVDAPAPATHSRTTSVTGPDDKERKARELLDIELDMHAKAAEDNGPFEGEETAESLQAKLARLRAEAKALGITDASAPPYTPSHRGFRGRGRGRANYRGGPPRVSMKLDNRTKSLLVKGVSSHDPEVVQALRSWYEGGGQLTSLDVHDDDSLVAHFKTRAAAEQALVKGTSIPSAGSVKLSWHNDASPPKAVPISDKKPAAFNEDRPPSPRPEDVSEDTGGTRWGNEEDMGMF